MSKTLKQDNRNKNYIKNTDDLNNIFFSKSFQLFLNEFDQSQDTNAIVNIPPMKNEIEPKAEAKTSFNSRITELRIKRNHDNTIANHKEQASTLEKRMKRLEELSKNNQDNIDDAFKKESAERAEIPAYIRHEEEDLEKMKTRRSAQSRKSIDIANTVKQFEKRLKESQENGEKRAKERRMRLEGKKPK